ncbi:ABC transporter glutamine-binding protein GlnH [Gottschalkia purinilytica]|uniref:ABC transporter glutamine-binding protein GlnH n=1 Tax=Gottschalkia purinilytica TaxID=1503 RepID=A0A0L0W9J4_GOTPU|nr:transporter substrate-binding domain-containing protein [Gottschalkia purinilytica]KNF08111.1 ABC transporter glutamine-binding protein GlnH [Gottschalkia purinilytica]
MKKFAVLLVVLSLIAGVLAGCGQSKSSSNEKQQSQEVSKDSSKEKSNEIQKIKDRGKILIGIFTDKPPFGYVDENGKNDGFEVALSKRFAKDLLGDESKLEFVPLEPENRIPFLQSDKVDLIMANMTVTDERKQVVDFTNPHLKVAIQILAKDNSKITSVDDLKGKKVIVTKGTTADIYFTKNHPDIELIKFTKVTESFQALKDDRGDVYVNDNLLLFDFVKDNKGFKVLDIRLEEPSPIAPAVKKGNKELKEWVNQELSKLGEEKYLHKLYDEYLKESFGDNVKNPTDVIVEGGKWE